MNLDTWLHEQRHFLENFERLWRKLQNDQLVESEMPANEWDAEYSGWRECSVNGTIRDRIQQAKEGQ